MASVAAPLALEAFGMEPPTLRVVPLFDRQKRVVVAEDDDDLRALITEAFNDAGLEVIACKDGAELTATLRTLFDLKDPDVVAIVSDNRMPKIEGLEILKGVRKAHRDVPLFVISAFADDDLKKRASALGAVVVSKPFDVDDLVALVGGVARGPLH